MATRGVEEVGQWQLWTSTNKIASTAATLHSSWQDKQFQAALAEKATAIDDKDTAINEKKEIEKKYSDLVKKNKAQEKINIDENKEIENNFQKILKDKDTAFRDIIDSLEIKIASQEIKINDLQTLAKNLINPDQVSKRGQISGLIEKVMNQTGKHSIPDREMETIVNQAFEDGPSKFNRTKTKTKIKPKGGKRHSKQKTHRRRR